MKLFLHIGIHKTGSSYLQYLCANKRDELLNNGIWFPISDQETKMKKGEISAGNALELCQNLRKGDSTLIENYFKTLRSQAESKKANAVLLSAEGLGHDLSEEKKLKMVQNEAHKAGFEAVSVIAYFRNLVDHCLSLYKHRSKSGKNPDFDYWVKEVYETPEVLQHFFSNYQKVDFEWTLRKFKKDADFMHASFFKEWLGVELTSIPEKPKVNESITLSEVKLMQQLKKRFPKTSDYFLKKLIDLPKNKKAKDQVLEQNYRADAATILTNKYEKHVDEWNKQLITDESIQIEPYERDNEDNFDLSLSPSQLSVLISGIQYLSSYRSFFLRLRRFMTVYLPKSITKKLVRLK